jgi:hypothetical protein
VSRSRSKKTRLDRFLTRVTEESLEETMGWLFEDEKERQADMEGQLSGLDDGKKKKSDEVDEGDDEPEKTATSVDVSKEDAPGVVPDAEEIAEAGASEIIDKLNVMRSGKSLKDDDVRKNIELYVKGLDTGTRQMLFVGLTGLAQVMSGDIDGEEAVNPGDVDLEVQGKRRKKDMDEPDVKEKSNTPEEAPIVVGESARKGAVRQRVLELMRR